MFTGLTLTSTAQVAVRSSCTCWVVAVCGTFRLHSFEAMFNMFVMLYTYWMMPSLFCHHVYLIGQRCENIMERLLDMFWLNNQPLTVTKTSWCFVCDWQWSSTASCSKFQSRSVVVKNTTVIYRKWEFIETTLHKTPRKCRFKVIIERSVDFSFKCLPITDGMLVSVVEAISDAKWWELGDNVGDKCTVPPDEIVTMEFRLSPSEIHQLNLH
jgi:hypothetical protein